MTRRDMIRALEENPANHAVQGYWLDGAWPSRDDDTSKACERAMCETCGLRAERLLWVLRHEDRYDHTVGLAECWAGAERTEHCHRCGVLLNCGGLLRYGIQDVLAIDEPTFSPTEPQSTAGEYLLAACSMQDDDPLWEVWESQVEALLSRGGV